MPDSDQPAESQSVEYQPAESQSAESQSAESQSVESQPAESPHSSTDGRHGARRGGRRRAGRRRDGRRRGGAVGRAPWLIGAVAAGVVVGSATFLTVPPDVTESESDPSADQIENARSSLDSANLMFGLMSSAVTGATGSVEKIVGGAESVFDAVDRASGASEHLVSGLRQAPDAKAAAAQVQRLSTSIGAGLDRARDLTAAADQMNSLVTPLLRFVESSKAPGTRDLVETLTALQKSGAEIARQSDTIDALRGELRGISSSVDGASAEFDRVIGEARRSAEQLESGMKRLASARGETVKAAGDVGDGVRELQKVLDGIGGDIDSAASELEPADEVVAVDRRVDDADRTAVALLAGSGTSLVLMVVFVLVARRRARHGEEELERESAELDRAARERPTGGAALRAEDVPGEDDDGRRPAGR
ncbi:hypothetical protein [Gordonia shandongensis]|uniref:hypothetical protein n=1 Tax=Gordonia shandongensis TaxID=376351 RepID=UPI00047D1CD3|nr:hypothetical protein [Gordonia shandongensis]